MKDSYGFISVFAGMMTVLIGVHFFIAAPQNTKIDVLTNELEALKSQLDVPRREGIMGADQSGVLQNTIEEVSNKVEALEREISELQRLQQSDRITMPGNSGGDISSANSEQTSPATTNRVSDPETLGKAFQSDTLKVAAINVAVADTRKSIRVTTQFTNLSDEVLYLADHGMESEVGSTEAGDAFGNIQLDNIKRIASLRPDTYDIKTNYTPLNPNSKMFVVWNIPMRNHSDRVQGKRLNLRSEILTLTSNGPESIPVQLEDIPIN